MTHPPSFNPPTLISKEEGFAQMGMAGPPRVRTQDLLAQIDERLAHATQSLVALETALAPALEPQGPQPTEVGAVDAEKTSALNEHLETVIDRLQVLSERVHDMNRRVAL